VPAGTELAHCVGPGSEGQVGAVLESDLAVRARRQAFLSLLGYSDVLTTTIDGGGFAEGTSRRERSHDAPHNGALSSMHRIGIHVEDARAIPEADEGADDGGVVVEENSASQDETAISGTRTEVGARSGGVVEAATFLRTNLAVGHLHLRGGAEGDREEQRDMGQPNQTPGFARVESLHGPPLCGLAAAHRCSLMYGQQVSVGGAATSSPRVMRELLTLNASQSARGWAEILDRSGDSSQVIPVWRSVTRTSCATTSPCHFLGSNWVLAGRFGIVLPALAFFAACTRTLRLGTGVCLVPQRNPVYTAKAVASADWLSGGHRLRRRRRLARRGVSSVCHALRPSRRPLSRVPRGDAAPLVRRRLRLPR
jgi:hypothetical protein